MSNDGAITVEVEEVQKESEKYPTLAKNLAAGIKDDESYKQACSMMIAIKGFRKQVTEFFMPAKKKAKEAHESVCALEKKAGEPLDRAEAILKSATATYVAEAEERRLNETSRLQSELKKQQESNRMKEIITAEASGDSNKAQEIFDRKMPSLPPVILTKAEKVDGVSYRDNWKFAVVTLKDLVDAVSKGTVPLAAVIPNDKFLSQQARSLKTEMQYPGVNVWSEKTVAVKA